MTLDPSWTVVRDRDRNTYVIPEDKTADWSTFLNQVEQWTAELLAGQIPEGSPRVPEWAHMVDALDAPRFAAQMSAGPQ